MEQLYQRSPEEVPKVIKKALVASLKENYRGSNSELQTVFLKHFLFFLSSHVPADRVAPESLRWGVSHQPAGLFLPYVIPVVKCACLSLIYTKLFLHLLGVLLRARGVKFPVLGYVPHIWGPAIGRSPECAQHLQMPPLLLLAHLCSSLRSQGYLCMDSDAVAMET